MGNLSKSDLPRFVERAVKLARRTVVQYSSKYSKTRYTLRQRVFLLCLKVKKTTTFRDLVDELIEMPRIRDVLDLESIPAPSTLYKAFDRLKMVVWRVLLNISLANLPLNRTAGIDASGFERVHTSAYYTKRTNLIQQLSWHESTLLPVIKPARRISRDFSRQRPSSRRRTGRPAWKASRRSRDASRPSGRSAQGPP